MLHLCSFALYYSFVYICNMRISSRLNFTFIIILLLAIVSCSNLTTADIDPSRLAVITELCETDPDSALTIINDLNLDKSYNNKAIGYYLKGRARLNMLNYPGAVEAFLYAEKTAGEEENDSILALSRLGLMDVSDSIQDFTGKVQYAMRICAIYEQNNDYQNLYKTLEELTFNHSPLPLEFHPDIMRYASLIKDINTTIITNGDSIKMDGERLCNYLIGQYGKTNMISISIGCYLKSFDLNKYIEIIKSNGPWRTELLNDSTDITLDYANLVVLYLWDQGYEKEAGEFIQLYRNRYREKDITYTIDPATNAVKGHVRLLPPDPKKLPSTFQNNVKSVASRFHYEEELMHAKTIRFQRAMLISISALSIVSIIAIALYMRLLTLRRRRREYNNIRTATELRSALMDMETLHLRTLSHLCNAYYDSYNKESVKSKIAKDTLNTINEIAEAPDFFDRLEARLNESCDNLMVKFRAEATGIKEQDLRLFICNAIGLTIPAICLLIKEKRDVVYTRRLRLRAKIQESDYEHREIFLEHLR